MSTFTQEIIHTADTCGCCAKVRQTFNLVLGEPTGDPTNEILEWFFRCDAHKNMTGIAGYERIVWEMRAINTIETSLIAAAPAEELVEETLDDGSKIVKLKNEIEVVFSDKMYVTIPPQLSGLEGTLQAMDNVDFTWQK